MTPEDSWVARWQRIGKPDYLILTYYVVQCDHLAQGISGKTVVGSRTDISKKKVIFTIKCLPVGV